MKLIRGLFFLFTIAALLLPATGDIRMQSGQPVPGKGALPVSDISLVEAENFGDSEPLDKFSQTAAAFPATDLSQRHDRYHDNSAYLIITLPLERPPSFFC